MPNYTPNPFHMQTPIGQAAQNAIGMFLQAKLMEGQRADKQAQLALKQREFDEVTLPMKQAQIGKFQAEADKDAAAAAQMKNMPGVIARAITGMTVPQETQVRGFQGTGEWGPRTPFAQDMHPDENIPIAGLQNLAERPAFFTPQMAEKLSFADTISAMPSNADQLAKAMQVMSNMQFIQSNPSAADAGVRGRATAATQGDALYSSPNSQGLLGDLFTGMVMNQNNPLANAQVSADNALAGERNATAGLRREQVNTEKAQQRNYDEPNGGSSGGAGGKKSLEAVQKFNDSVVSARKMIASMKSKDDIKSKVNQKTYALAQQRMRDGDPRYEDGDPKQADWVAYLSGKGFEDGVGYEQGAAQAQAQAVQGAKPSGLPPKDKLVKGQVYETPKGPMMWTGTGFKPGT